MGNLGVCEIEVPETKENAPTWKVAGKELLDGDEAFIIESEGNTLVPLVQERMAKVFAKALPGDPAEQPSVKVLEYSAKHWISTSDYRHLQAVQISKVEVSVALPGGKQQLIEQSSKATSRYRYDKVTIEIPEAAGEDSLCLTVSRCKRKIGWKKLRRPLANEKTPEEGSHPADDDRPKHDGDSLTVTRS